MRLAPKIVAIVLVEALCATAVYGAVGSPKEFVVRGIRDIQAPRTVGWLYGVELTGRNRARIAAIAATARGADPVVDMTRVDFEILAQDLKRARAAYPDVPVSELTEAVPVGVPFVSRVPASMVGARVEILSDADGTDYADGVAMVTVVRPAFPARLDARATKAFFTRKASPGVTRSVSIPTDRTGA